MMRGGAMRNRAPRFFWWLRFVAHFFGSRRMRGIRGIFWGGWIFLNTNLTNFAKKGFGGVVFARKIHENCGFVGFLLYL